MYVRVIDVPLTGLTLTPPTYQVFRRVPEFWIDELTARREIAVALAYSALEVGKRLDYLRRIGLLERRRSPKIGGEYEIRRVGRE